MQFDRTNLHYSQITDKATDRIQHAAMLISCPHCQAKYEIETTCDDTVLLCHRCGIEFAVADQADNPNEQEIEKLQDSNSGDCADQRVAEEAETSGMPEVSDTDSEKWPDIAPPKRKRVRIWPWLMIMLTLIFSAGFWLQKDAWLDNRWFRSTAINLGFSMQLRDKDWRVIPDSIDAEWIRRDDASQALLIRGRVKNLLTSELPAPVIEVIFFSDLHPDQKLGSQRLIITVQPDKPSIQRVPYTAPEPNTLPVMPEGERKFVFLIESVPEHTGDFTLTARVR